ncbi:MAG: protein-disulfide reductase DsbD family protein [Pseudohongiellaceae bacterium]|nr:protein-disulfide reductase DsbD family protein [Pseudohongiellaceae bacterium]
MRAWSLNATQTSRLIAPSLVKLLQWGVALLVLVLSVNAWPQGLTLKSNNGIGQAKFLPVTEAFPFYTALPNAKQLTVTWEIAPEYYLYKDKFSFAINGHTVSATLPQAQQHHDAYFGDVEVFYQRVEAVLALPEPVEQQQIELELQFQGCAEAGLCYPPQTQVLTLDL